jgi:hypothetical protein
MESIVGFMLILPLMAVYFFPSAIAIDRRHRNRLAIAVLNLVGGWTLVGWVIALVWSCSADVEPRPEKPVPPRHQGYESGISW